MKTQKKLTMSDLLFLTAVDTNLHGWCPFNSLPFDSSSKNMRWDVDKSASELLIQKIPGSEKHNCCALDTKRPATIEEIITGLGGIDMIVPQHLFSYQSVAQIAAHCPTCRRFPNDQYSAVKEEMNIFFSLGKENTPCVLGVSFAWFPSPRYKIFAQKVFDDNKKETHSAFSFFRRGKKNNRIETFPAGTRVFLIGEPEELFDDQMMVNFSKLAEHKRNSLQTFVRSVLGHSLSA